MELKKKKRKEKRKKEKKREKMCTILPLQNCIIIDAFNNFSPVFPLLNI